MTHHMEVLLEVSDVRGIVALMVIDEPIAPIVVDVARDTLEDMRQEAAKGSVSPQFGHFLWSGFSDSDFASCHG